MRYLLLIVAYMLLAFIVGLGYLFPNKPVFIFDIFVVAAVLLPVIALFDFVGQKIIESQLFNGAAPVLRLVIAIVVLALFLGAVHVAIGLLEIELESW